MTARESFEIDGGFFFWGGGGSGGLFLIFLFLRFYLSESVRQSEHELGGGLMEKEE